MRFRSRTATLAGLGLTAVLTLSACGGSGGSDASASPGGGRSGGSNTDQMVAFAKCLRQHGVNMPDPKPGQNLQQWIQGAGVDRSQLRTATQKCQDKLPPGIKARATDPQTQDKKLKYAQCMRANGVDMPDPKNGQIDFGNLDRNSPQFKKASQKCRTYLLGGQ